MTTRIQSIDIFRGLTILTMVFVNDLAGVRGIPAWMKHAVDGSDSMTFVDIVFPAFLFIVGMSIPLSLQRRRTAGASTLALWKHVLSRFAGLLVLGVFMVNIAGLNPYLTGLSRHVWSTLFFVAAIAVWSRPPEQTARNFLARHIARFVGITAIVALAVIYRSGETLSPGWMHTQWWGILGLIGWTYLFCSGAYILFGESLAALTAFAALAVALYVGDKSGALKILGPINDLLWLGGHIGGHVSIATAGMIAGLLTARSVPEFSPRKTALRLTGMATALALGGYLLRPLYGISKNMATPTWSLYSAAICSLIFLLLYWIADVRKGGRVFSFAEPAGANPLLAYLLPDIFYGVIAMLGIESMWDVIGAGIVGVARSIAFSAAIIWLTAYLTRLGVRLRL
jgi:heparan-alpha-glucosaminide N-acetyltransferase